MVCGAIVFSIYHQRLNEEFIYLTPPSKGTKVFVRVFSSYHMIPGGLEANPANHEGGVKYLKSSLKF